MKPVIVIMSGIAVAVTVVLLFQYANQDLTVLWKNWTHPDANRLVYAQIYPSSGNKTISLNGSSNQTNVIFAFSNKTTPTSMPDTANLHFISPVLLDSDKQEIINASLKVQGLKSWSNQWQYFYTDYIGTINSTVTWNYAVVHLKLSTDNNAPFNCQYGWSAAIKVDLLTKQVVEAHYPTVQNHDCNLIVGGKVQTTDDQSFVLSPFISSAAAATIVHGFSTATENDITSGSWYGDVAQLGVPSYNSNIFTDMNQYIEQFENADWNFACGNPQHADCFTQGGWIITSITSTCGPCNINANTEDLVYVDQSYWGDYRTVNTLLIIVPGQPETTTISCGLSNYTISITHATHVFNHITNVPCTAYQTSDKYNNSVFFENAYVGPSSNWSKDVLSPVYANSAGKFDSIQGLHPLSSSSNVDNTDSFVNSGSLVLTGSIASSNTATWSFLNRHPTSSQDCPLTPLPNPWTITSSCTLKTTSSEAGNIAIQSGSVLTIPSNVILHINLAANKITLNSGSAILIESNGIIKQ